jgi:hypothetical protein
MFAVSCCLIKAIEEYIGNMECLKGESRRQTKEDLTQCHFVHDESHVMFPGAEP